VAALVELIDEEVAVLKEPRPSRERISSQVAAIVVEDELRATREPSIENLEKRTSRLCTIENGKPKACGTQRAIQKKHSWSSGTEKLFVLFVMIERICTKTALK
jgi:hypothetical protein